MTTIEQTATVTEDGKLTVTIESQALHAGETVTVTVTPPLPEIKGQFTSLFGAAKRTKRGQGSFSSEQEIDDFINDFRGE